MIFVQKGSTSLLFFLLVFIYSSLSAQDKPGKPHWYIEPVIQYGRIIPNSKDFHYLWNISMYGMDLKVGKQTTGEHEWEQWFNYPDFGVCLRYANFNDDRFGNNIAIFGYMNGTFFSFKKIDFNYSFGLGIMHWVKHYDPYLNPDNEFIGSALNAHIDLTLGTEYKLSDETDIFLRANFSHTSNGALALPNRGINVLSAQAGFRYHVNGKKTKIRTIDTITTFVPCNTLYFFVAPGFRQSKVNLQYYLKTGVQLGFSRQFHPRFSLGAGIDLNYSGELAALLPKEKQQKWKYYNQAAFASFEIAYDRFIVHVAFALYLNKAFNYYSPYYERVGFRILLGEKRKHFIGFAIKAHAGNADCLEWTYGYSFLQWNDRKVKRFRN